MTRTTILYRPSGARYFIASICMWLFIAAMLAVAILTIVAGIPRIAAYALTPFAHLLGGSQ